MLATVISFCTNDYRFLKYCIEGIASVSSQIIIPVCDHFFDGKLENLSLLEEIYKEYPHIQFIEFAYDSEQLYGTFVKLPPFSPAWGNHWHNTGRLIAYYFLNPEINDVLFCDVDEVFEKSKLELWLKKTDLEPFEAVRFSTYWYFREACFQATTYPDGPLLVKKRSLTPELLLDEDERMGMFLRLQGQKERLVLGIDGKPMAHHFSWVKTKEEMVQKTGSWSHHWERKWKDLIDEEFSRDFNGTDFVRKYKYQKIRPIMDPLTKNIEIVNQISLSAHRENIKSFVNVKTMSPKELFRIELLRSIN